MVDGPKLLNTKEEMGPHLSKEVVTMHATKATTCIKKVKTHVTKTLGDNQDSPMAPVLLTRALKVGHSHRREEALEPRVVRDVGTMPLTHSAAEQSMIAGPTTGPLVVTDARITSLSLLYVQYVIYDLH